jgi:sec-independent protein translocase protein TatA
MARGVGGRRFRLAQAGSGSDGEHQALISHLQQIRAQPGVMEEALFELEKDEIERSEQLGVREVPEQLAQVFHGRIPFGLDLRIHTATSVGNHAIGPRVRPASTLARRAFRPLTRWYNCWVPLNPLEIALIALILVLLFSAKRIPEMGRSLGRGMREFKDAITDSDKDEQASVETPERIDLSSPPAPPSDAAETPTTKRERVSG